MSPIKNKVVVRNKGIFASSRGVAKFINRYLATGSIPRQLGNGHKTKIIPEIQQIVETQMQSVDETTPSQLHILLAQLGHRISLRAILHCRTALGWTFRGSAYCQLI